MSMIGFVDWTDVEVREDRKGSGNNANSIFMRFSPGKFRVRPIGQPYFYLQTFIPKKLTGAAKDIPIVSPGPNNDPLIKLGINPTQRGALNVIHRDDGNRLKIMRFGSSVYKHIRTYAIDCGVDPADLKEGVDFSITVEDPGGNPRNRQYTVTALNNTPITKEEYAKIKEDGGIHDLEKYFKPTPIEEINEIIEQYDLVEKLSNVSGDDTDFEDSGSDEEDGDDEDEYSF